MFDEDSDDFQLPDNFDNLVNVAADGVLSLRHLYYPNKNGKRRKISKKKTGPSVSTLRLTLYHLPQNEQVPQKIRNVSDPVAATHIRMGYGKSTFIVSPRFLARGAIVKFLIFEIKVELLPLWLWHKYLFRTLLHSPT